MYQCDFRALVIDICNNLTPRAEWQARPRRARVRFSEQILPKLTALRAWLEIVVVEHLTKLGGGYDTDGR